MPEVIPILGALIDKYMHALQCSACFFSVPWNAQILNTKVMFRKDIGSAGLYLQNAT